jgi:isocitrate dehydrogenase
MVRPILKASTPLKSGEIIDSSVMNLKLKSFVAKAIEEAKRKRIAFSALESNNDENFRSNYFGAVVEVLQPYSKNIALYLLN